MMSFTETVHALIDDAGAAAKLDLADQYIRMYVDIGPAMFVLPYEHRALKPIIESFAEDQQGFIEFLRAIRNRCTHGTVRDQLNALYRRVMTRVLQQGRRRRIARALKVALAKGYVEDDVEAKRGYEKRCVAMWKRRRRNLLEATRMESRTHHITKEDRAAILEDFWCQVDAEIAAGEVPI